MLQSYYQVMLQSYYQVMLQSYYQVMLQSYYQVMLQSYYQVMLQSYYQVMLQSYYQVGHLLENVLHQQCVTGHQCIIISIFSAGKKGIWLNNNNTTNPKQKAINFTV